MIRDNPTRLRNTEEFGRLLESAEPPALSDERLLRNFAALRAAIGAPMPTSAPWLTRGGALGKLAIVATTFAVVAGVVAIAVALHRPVRTDVPRVQLVLPPQIDPLARVALPEPKPPSPLRHVPHASNSRRSIDSAASAPTTSSASAPTTSAANAPTTSASPSPTPGHRSDGSRPPQKVLPAVESSLAIQLRLYAAAQAAARDHDYRAAIVIIDDLLIRFPNASISSEAELGRADYLARAGQRREAATAVERLLHDDRHAGRRAELGRFLADLELGLGECDHARAALSIAVAAGLAETEQASLVRGLAKCGTR